MSRDAFAAFAARRTARAINARTAPYVTVAAHPNACHIPIGTPWTMATFGGPFYVRQVEGSDLPTCSLVFVQSADRNTVAEDPATLGGGATDYHVVYEGLSRVAADAVMAGAGTVRGGNTVFSVWHPELADLRATSRLPRHPAQIVTTLRGIDLEHGLLFNTPELQVFVLTGSEGAAAMQRGLEPRPWIRVVPLRHRRDLAAAFAVLRTAGIGRISCIGGRQLAADLLALNLVDDVYLTTAAREGGTPHTPLPAEAFDGALILKKHGTGDDAGVTFEHLDLKTPRRTPDR